MDTVLGAVFYYKDGVAEESSLTTLGRAHFGFPFTGKPRRLRNLYRPYTRQGPLPYRVMNSRRTRAHSEPEPRSNPVAHFVPQGDVEPFKTPRELGARGVER